MNLSSNNILVSRDYNFSISGESQTKVIRDLQDIQLSFYFATKLLLKNYFHKLGLVSTLEMKLILLIINLK
jgi:hypothetical protein